MAIVGDKSYINNGQNHIVQHNKPTLLLHSLYQDCQRETLPLLRGSENESYVYAKEYIFMRLSATSNFSAWPVLKLD